MVGQQLRLLALSRQKMSGIEKLKELTGETMEKDAWHTPRM
jgi:hypothetical protein